ncbi:RNA-binding domain-containing protein [Lepidopterella palustris CBS 459.81]|uniref:RNA-binding domain-containing protein n=1 Tax=Lepidopterella palustris CBS 459.81 TaxID=1314670 RepID=A0A8E2EGY8_9PEZI|nr:RNA-binding domain-containing protein [Lepidopterella palustris CBS 459.81]
MTKESKEKAIVEDPAVTTSTKKNGKKSKKTKDPRETPVAQDTAVISPAETNGKKSKQTKEAKTKAVVEEIGLVQDEEDEDEDDQTAALLAGFESSEDEADAEKDDGLDVDKLPEIPSSKALRTKLDMVASENARPGVVYVGRIPHGFYEHQMRAYFSQFGDIARLRLSRNRKTGASKHYAFIEFKHAEVADIVAKTMDKYLLFGHILQVSVIPPEQVHMNLFKGANKRYKAIPRNKMEGASLKRGLERHGWEKKIKNEDYKRRAKAEKLKALGYEYEAPTLRSVDVVPKKVQAIENGAEESPKLLADVPLEETMQEQAKEELKEVIRIAQAEPGSVTVTEEFKVKKSKKDGKGDADVVKEKKRQSKVEKKDGTNVTKVKKGKGSVA